MKDRVQALLKKTFDPKFLSVRDDSDGCGDKLFLIVVSHRFEGVGLVDRQKQVYKALDSVMNEIHAVQMKTWTPEQYEKKKATLASS